MERQAPAGAKQDRTKTKQIKQQKSDNEKEN